MYLLDTDLVIEQLTLQITHTDLRITLSKRTNMVLFRTHSCHLVMSGIAFSY